MSQLTPITDPDAIAKLAQLSKLQEAVCKHRGEKKGVVKVACACKNKEWTNQPSFACEKHGRCLPYYRPVGEAKELWVAREPEASIFALCSQCPDFD